ncbi:MAG: FliO/MopB family protein [Aquabacterium sp.]
MTTAWTSLLAFAAVIALIPVALWLLRRSPYGAAAARGGPARVVGSLPLAPGQRLLTVEVGQGDERRWLLLGVTNGGISRLHEMAPGPADAPQAPSFSALLKGSTGASDAR